MNFLSGEKVLNVLRKQISDTKSLCIAVSYWGDGAISQLELDKWPELSVSAKHSNITVVCDLMSGACNPDEIARLMKLIGASNVLKCDKLHAKVWIMDHTVVIGSANASANGLGYEGKETKSLFEACVFIDDKKIHLETSIWFKRHILKNASRISKGDIKMAREKWEIKRSRRPLQIDKLCKTNNNFLDIMQRYPEILKDRQIKITTYGNVASKNAVELFAKVRKEKNLSERDWDFYETLSEEAGVRSDDIILDLNFINSKKPTFDGVYRVPDLGWAHIKDTKTSIVVIKNLGKKMPFDNETLTLTPFDISRLKKMVTAWIKEDSEKLKYEKELIMPLYDFLERFNSPSL